jgi:polysaccharide biosynthesis protein PslG
MTSIPCARTRRPLAALLAVSAALAAAAAAAPSANASAELAVQDDKVFLFRAYGDRDKAFVRAKEMHAKWIRFNVIWGDYVARGKDFALWDDAVDTARAKGFKVQMTIAGTPRYAPQQDQALSWKNPSPTRMRTFARDVAAHFQGRVKRYSIWNEFNLTIWLKRNKYTPVYYRNLYKAGYAAIKAADPAAKVFIGEMASGKDALGLFRKVAARGANLRADGFAHHPFQFYTYPGARELKYAGISNLAKMQAMLRDVARVRGVRSPSGGALPIYYTEFGYLRRGIYTMTETKRSQWTFAAYRLIKRQGAVKQFLWYQIYTPPVKKLLWDSSLLTPSNTPYRTFGAIQAATRGWRQP